MDQNKFKRKKSEKKLRLEFRLKTKISIYTENLIYGKKSIEDLKEEFCQEVLEIFNE